MWARSRVALALLQRAAQQGVRFSVIVTEGRPDETGLSMARALDELHVPVTLVLDSGAAYILERCTSSGTPDARRNVACCALHGRDSTSQMLTCLLPAERLC